MTLWNNFKFLYYEGFLFRIYSEKLGRWQELCWLHKKLKLRFQQHQNGEVESTGYPTILSKFTECTTICLHTRSTDVHAGAEDSL